MSTTPKYQQIYALVCQIPYGKVATYGQIAKELEGCTARMVGYALSSLQDTNNVPWQRVINAQGKISPRGGGEILQYELLRAENIFFDEEGKVESLPSANWLSVDAQSLF